MALPTNIARFNRTVLGVLAFLYERFPKPVKINLIEMTSSLFPEDEDTHTEYWTTMGALGHSVTWLEEEGFLRYERCDGKGDFHGARLTHKGLAAMGAIPKSLKGTKPLIDRAKAALESGTEKAASDTVRAILMATVKGVGDAF